MSIGNGIVIKIGADVSDAIRDINRVESALGRNLTAGEQFGRGMGVASTALIGATAAAGAFAIKLGVDAVNAAVEDEKAVATLARTMENLGFGDQAAAAEELIGRMQIMYGVADAELRPAYDRLLRSTRNVAEAERVLQIALDASFGTGKSLESVAAALGRAYDGNTGSLGKLGLGIDAATLKSGDLDRITSRMAQTFSGQAYAASQTFGGQLAIMGQAAEEASEQVGYALLRAIEGLNKALGGSGGAASALDDASDSLADFIDGVAVALEALAGFSGAAESTESVLEGFAGIIRNTVEVFFPWTRGLFVTADLLLDIGPLARKVQERVAAAGGAAGIAGVQFGGLAASVAAATVAMAAAVDAARAPGLTFGGLNNALANAKATGDAAAAAARLQGFIRGLNDSLGGGSGGGGGGGGLAQAIDKVNPRLKAQTALTERHIEKLGILRDRVSELVKEQDDYIRSTADQISSGISFSAVFDADNVAKSIEAFRAQIGDVAKFSTALAGLASRIGTSPGAQALLAQIADLGAANGNAVLAGMTDEVAIGLAGDLSTALGTVNGNASTMGTVFYQEGINSAVALMDSMAVQVAKDEEKLRAIGKQIGAPIGAEIKAAVTAALAEAMAASAGIGAAAAGAAAAASVTAAGTVIINGATVIDPTNVARVISTAQAKARARTGGGP